MRRLQAGGYQVDDLNTERRYFFAETGDYLLPPSMVSDGDGNRIELVHDTRGTLTELRHSAGHCVVVSTDGDLITALDLVTSADTDDLRLVEYRYDADRQPVGATKPPLAPRAVPSRTTPTTTWSTTWRGHGVSYGTTAGHNAVPAPVDHTAASEMHRDLGVKSDVDLPGAWHQT